MATSNTGREQHVIFGIGPLGRSVMRELLAHGDKDVRVINRSGKADVPAGVEVVKADAYDPAQVAEVTRDAAVVYQCAQPAYHEWEEKFPPLLTSIIDGVSETEAVLIVGDNLYMYGEVDGPIHEGLPYNAHTRKGRVRAAMAREVLQAHEQGTLKAALVRGSDFYGPHVMGSALGDRVFYPLLKGKAAQVAGDIDAPHSYTFIDDFGRAMVAVGSDPSAWGQVWHAPNAPVTSTREVVEKAAAHAGQPPKMQSMGKLMMRIGGLFIPEAREMVEMMYEFEKPFVVDSSKFEGHFGIHATPLDEGLKQTIDWFRANPDTAH